MKNWALSLVVLIAGFAGGYFVRARAGTAPVAAPAAPSPGGATAGASMLDRVKADGHLVVGIGQEAAPFGYRESGNLVGFDVEIANAVAKRLEDYIGRKLAVEF